MSFEEVVQKAVYEKLIARAALLGREINIYDDVPIFTDEKTIFPFIALGDDTLVNWDTDTELGADVTLTLNVWSRYRGKKEIKDLQGFIYDTLHRADFSVVGYKIITCEFVQSQSFMDFDGLTRHGVQTFQLLIEKL